MDSILEMIIKDDPMMEYEIERMLRDGPVDIQDYLPKRKEACHE